MVGFGRTRNLTVAAVLLLYPAATLVAAGQRSPAPPKLDPAAWGTDHVGKPRPEFATGDECLFCHRRDVGAAWQRNRHNRTVRPVEADPAALSPLRREPALRKIADEVTHILGGTHRTRYLKRGTAYGQLELLTVQYQPASAKEPGRLIGAGSPSWNRTRFGASCAGCHATAADLLSGATATLAVDCGACHGAVQPEHANKESRAFLASDTAQPARVVVSLCASCHVRTGRSRSTGKPFPNNFAAGDNVFRDLAIPLRQGELEAQNPIDRHVLENVRDVAVLNRTGMTCLSCHHIHTASTLRHRTLKRQPACDTCHLPKSTQVLNYEVHSSLCGY